MNNEALGMIRHLQRDYFDCLFAGTTDGCGFASCDFAGVAKAYGIPALRMHCDAVKEEAPEFLEGEGPKLLEVMLEHGTFAYPKTCLGEPIQFLDIHLECTVSADAGGRFSGCIIRSDSCRKPVAHSSMSAGEEKFLSFMILE